MFFSPFHRVLLYLHSAIKPISKHEDDQRREFILYVLLLPTIIFFTFSLLVAFSRYSIKADYNGLSPTTLLLLVVVLVGLLITARMGWPRSAAVIFSGSLFLIPVYGAYRWGVDVPASSFFFALLIVIVGILLKSSFAFLVVAGASVCMMIIGHLHLAGVVKAERAWTTGLWGTPDIILVSVFFLIIATVSWLSNREIERSLVRARRSEAELKEERDMLEVRVRERTEALRQAEMEKLAQTYRFVEFGRLASGLFHDLMNPLTALSLNIERIAGSQKDVPTELLADDIDRAKRTAAHMQRLMDGMRKHLSHEGDRTEFVIEDMVREVVRVLDTYGRMRNVRISFTGEGVTTIHGDPVHFTQIVTNLVSNAVESYPKEEEGSSSDRIVHVDVQCDEAECRVFIRDHGQGISSDRLDRIFEPFVTSKGSEGGFGLGLSLARRMVEREFGGRMTVESSVGKGSTFVVHLPL